MGPSCEADSRSPNCCDSPACSHLPSRRTDQPTVRSMTRHQDVEDTRQRLRRGARFPVGECGPSSILPEAGVGASARDLSRRCKRCSLPGCALPLQRRHTRRSCQQPSTTRDLSMGQQARLDCWCDGRRTRGHSHWRWPRGPGVCGSAGLTAATSARHSATARVRRHHRSVWDSTAGVAGAGTSDTR